MCVATRDRKRTANLEGFGFAPQVGGDSAPRSVAYFRAAIGTAVWCRRGTRGETRSNHRETVLRARVRCAEGTVEDGDAPPMFWRSFFGKEKKKPTESSFYYEPDLRVSRTAQATPTATPRCPSLPRLFPYHTPSRPR